MQHCMRLVYEASQGLNRFLRYTESCACEGPRPSTVCFVENYVMWNYVTQNKFSVNMMRRI